MAKKPLARFAHTMIRVFDQDKAIDFYTRVLGMKVLRQAEYPGGRFTNTFVGYEGEDETATIELTYNWDQKEPYDKGNGWGHLAIEVPDVYKACDAVTNAGGTVTRPAGPMKHGTRVIAFVEDPDGYKIELVEARAD